MNKISIPSPTMTTNKRNNSSILPDTHPNVLEIQGYYWPRILLRTYINDPKKSNKKDEKKVFKALRRPRKAPAGPKMDFSLNSPLLSLTSDLSPASSFVDSPLLDTLPSLISENDHPQRTHVSTITGRTIAVVDKNFSRMVPTKTLRKHHQHQHQHSHRQRSN